jgi:carbonic anhydrase
MRHSIPWPLIGLVAIGCCAQSAFSQESHEWGYDKEHGPAKWAGMDPAFVTCGSGSLQSPINITAAVKVSLPEIAFNYHPSALKIIDNGHSIQSNYDDGSSITVGDTTYQLVQFHFHRPSENQYKGKTYPMEVHLVHKSADGKFAVVAVWLSTGKANPVIEAEWSHLPTEKGKVVTVPGVQIDAAQFLPEKRKYFSFIGSLTTPPCSEDVRWFVMKSATEVSSSEIKQFSKLYPRDARPVQPLNNRVIRESNK